MISGRVKADADAESFGDKLIKRAGKWWRVYEDGSYYSQTSGGVMKLGKVMRDAEGKPASFKTLKAAEEWIKAGCRVVDERGNPLRLR